MDMGKPSCIGGKQWELGTSEQAVGVEGKCELGAASGVWGKQPVESKQSVLNKQSVLRTMQLKTAPGFAQGTFFNPATQQKT